MPVEDENTNAVKQERARLLLTQWVKGEPLAYMCSLCDQRFLLPEDRDAKAGMAELWAAFKAHIDEEHREAAAGQDDGRF